MTGQQQVSVPQKGNSVRYRYLNSDTPAYKYRQVYSSDIGVLSSLMLRSCSITAGARRSLAFDSTRIALSAMADPGRRLHVFLSQWHRTPCILGITLSVQIPIKHAELSTVDS